MNHNPWLAHPSPVRLRHGCHLYRGADGHWYLFGPGDRIVRLRVPDEHASALAVLLTSEQPVQTALADTSDPIVLSKLLTQLERSDLLLSDQYSPYSLRDRKIVVQGANPVAAQLLHLLKLAGVESVDHVEEPSSLGLPDLLVTCAGWLPDTYWQSLDEWCSRQNVPWHTSYLEGDCFYIGPIALAGSTPTYRDVRARRLAAARWPDQLKGYWAYLDTKKNVTRELWPNPGVVGVVAGLLAADVLCLLAGLPIPSEGYQLEIDIATLAIHRHPVLPLPREILSEDANESRIPTRPS